MNKRVKERLLHLLEVLGRAETILRQLDGQQREETVQQLLEEMQETAISVGETIEKAKINGEAAVELLEEYCELLWQCAQAGEGNARLSVYDKLSDIQRQVSDYVKFDIAARREAVFLPYKASMWDSLESVWMAAAEDGGCDTYVIPIPYYDKNPDGSFAGMQYEGEQFPGYVPVTDYRDYDIAARLPDVIFIHNPYDEYNYVTSVHPDYYSAKLMDETGLLVYIPYFISLGEVPEWHCTERGVINADLVIVQSEMAKQTYIRTIAKAAGLSGGEAEKAGLSKKILALGSPKIDKVLRTRREDVELPEDWKRKIYGPASAAT